MRVLVTNDDGVDSEGLHVLAQTLVASGYDVVIAAPDRDMSGSSAALGQIHVDEHIDAERVDLPGLDGVPAYAVDGPPGLCVLAGHLGAFGEPPSVVVSGINPGANTGRAVLHSGTVGAAMTGASFGSRGLAVSLDVGAQILHEQAVAGATVPFDGSSPEGDGDASSEVSTRVRKREAPARWGTAATLAAATVRWLAGARRGVVLNLNVPNLPFDEIAGVAPAALAPFGRVLLAVVEPAEDSGRLLMELRPTTEELPPDSDTALVAEGFVAVSALSRVGLDERVDLSELLQTVPVRGWGSA